MILVERLVGRARLRHAAHQVAHLGARLLAVGLRPAVDQLVLALERARALPVASGLAARLQVDEVLAVVQVDLFVARRRPQWSRVLARVARRLFQLFSHTRGLI
jgi:hypothetical protein